MGRSGTGGRDGAAHADVSFVLVGPEQSDVSLLKTCPNIHLLGQRPHDEVPAYVNAFDVALIPYRLAEYTANVYPTKLNEYLVMGKPVVATDLPEIRRFNDTHGPSRASPRARRRSAPRPAARSETGRRRPSIGASRWRRRTAGAAGSIACSC